MVHGAQTACGIKKVKKINWFAIINGLLLLLITFLIVFPFYNSIVISLNDGQDTARGGALFFSPRVFTLESYRQVLKSSSFFYSFLNSIIRTVCTTLTALVLTSSYAYAMAHRELMFRKLYLMLGLITMYFSGGLIPTFLMYKQLGLYNNFLVYILPFLLDMFNVLIFLTFFREIPKELEECAHIDGANDFTVFFRIIVPVSGPAFACIALFVGVHQWNEWFYNMIFVPDESKQVLSYIFAKMVLTARYLETAVTETESVEALEALLDKGGATSLSLQTASMVLTIFPIIVLYPFLQKYFVKGIMVGSVKG